MGSPQTSVSPSLGPRPVTLYGALPPLACHQASGPCAPPDTPASGATAWPTHLAARPSARAMWSGSCHALPTRASQPSKTSSGRFPPKAFSPRLTLTILLSDINGTKPPWYDRWEEIRCSRLGMTAGKRSPGEEGGSASPPKGSSRSMADKMALVAETSSQGCWNLNLEPGLEPPGAILTSHVVLFLLRAGPSGGAPSMLAEKN